MTPATILRESASAGLLLSLSPNGAIKATGDRATVNRWLPIIRQHKAGIVGLLSAGNSVTAARWWLHFADREPLELACCPDATHAEVLSWYPDALAVEPFTLSAIGRATAGPDHSVPFQSVG